MKNRIVILALCLGAGVLAGCERDTATETEPTQTTQPRTTTESMPNRPVASERSMPMYNTSGTITAIDTQMGTVTVDHEPVAGLGWPATSNTFEIQDRSQLSDLNQGDQVRITFEQSGTNRYVISDIIETADQRLSQEQE